MVPFHREAPVKLYGWYLSRARDEEEEEERGLLSSEYID